MQIYPFCCQEWAYTSRRAVSRMRGKQMERNNSESNIKAQMSFNMLALNMHLMIAVTVNALL